jgi:hypothetical protein
VSVRVTPPCRRRVRAHNHGGAVLSHGGVVELASDGDEAKFVLVFASDDAVL